ncbi:28028_t:CDS:2 [Dentiscutata erythropus]|uniref:28028_t:CDS:1 n=1 Tax=Dentiscutata erythropus TaxID=1348616 RepID=A0A9N9EFR5_9GLOM|nr:28028_t:CDS:2 [Dentiscutata erythropus]
MNWWRLEPCCHKGAIVLPPLFEFHDVLKLIFLRRHPLSNVFFDHICKYNGAMAFASPDTNNVPTFRQLYFMETANTQVSRSNNPINTNLNSVLQSLLDLIIRQEEHNLAIEQHCQLMEVAAIFVDSGDYDFSSHCLAMRPHSDQLRTIPVINGNCDPMSYLLLFPRDYLALAAVKRGTIVKRAIVLASSFPESPRAIQQSYQDAMAICRAFDIVGKVFKLKLDMLMEDLLINKIFGTIVA